MINFFRKIRRKFADNNQFLKYSRYAIGEIALVMIGILLALQVNNWNEERNNSKYVKIALKSVRNELVNDNLLIDEQLIWAINEVNYNIALKNRAFNNEATIDTLIKIAKVEFRLYWVFHIKYSKNTFENLKSTGSFELLPTSIKIKLTDFYNTQKYLVHITEKANLQYQSRYEEFSKTYAVRYPLGAPPNSLIRQLTWEEVNPNHFAPRFEALIATKQLVWNRYLEELETLQKESRLLIEELKIYIE